MNNKEKNKIVPKLRFPEFKNSGEWVEETLGNAARFINGRAFKQEELLDNGKYRVLRVGNFFTNNEWYCSDLELESDKYCEDGDLLYAWSASFGPRIWKGEKVIYHYHIWKVVQNVGIDKKFLFILLGYETERMKTQSANGFALLHITKSTIESWKCYLPKFENEQKKIANCFSSIDEFIIAETKKLTQLKAHKKGLMQNLFPTEGETSPNLRFPEFKDNGEWGLNYLKDVLTIFQGFAFSSNDSVNEGVRWLKIADVGIQQMNYNSTSFLPFDYKEKYKNFLVKKGDYVIALTRPMLNKDLKIAQIDNVFHESLLNQRVGKLITNKHDGFVYYLFQTSKLISSIEKNIAGSEPPNLSFQQIENIEVYIPTTKKEQKKIADCLSTVDELITAQAQKIETLKLHKNGLMQQLFPVINEAN